MGKLGALKILDLSFNKLDGPIPPELGKLTALVELLLWGNQLSGHIPSELGKLGALQHLELWSNKLSGHIPTELGELAALCDLNLSGNNFSGGVPTSLEKHRNRRDFVFGVPPDGAPVPPYKSWLSVLVPLVVGYADLGTDVSTVISYYQVHMWWFAIGLTFLVGPALVAAFFFLREEDWYRRVFVALQLGLLWEAIASVSDEKYSHVLVSLRVVEPLYESVPQLMLQLYALLLEWKSDSSHWSHWLPLRLLSIVVSCASLAYATTGLVAEQPMSEMSPANGGGSAWFPRLTGLVFGTVPVSGL
ncbi:unnamed protein product [Ectocarpus sp. 6 AP-2014]